MKKRTRVTIGGVDVSEHVVDVKVVSALNKPDSATFRLLASVVDLPILDYNAQVAISRFADTPDGWLPSDPGSWRSTEQEGISEHLLFGGVVEAAIASGEDVEITCTGGFLELSDSDLGRLFTNIPDQERGYSIFRIAGIPDASMKSEGFDPLPEESFEVLVPIDDVTPDSAVRIGRVTFYPSDLSSPASRELARRMFSGTGKETELNRSFFAGDGLARVVTRSSSLYDAEQAGLSIIDEALAWITVRARDARGSLNKRLTEFRRSANLARPRRGGLVIVRGTMTGRSWVRVPGSRRRPSLLALSEGSSFLQPELQVEMPFGESQALAALSRAHATSDETTSILALWEALEFYAGDTKVAPLFDKAQRRALRAAIRDHGPDLTDEQNRRLNDVVGTLNSAPLFVRLRAAVINDAVPFTETEFKVLRDLRDARNSAVHGDVAVPLNEHTLRVGLSFASRMLVQRMLRRAGSR